MNPFDFVNSINSNNKPDIMTGSENDALMESSYVPFVVNRTFSYFPETVLLANQVNLFPQLDNHPTICQDCISNTRAQCAT